MPDQIRAVSCHTDPSTKTPQAPKKAFTPQMKKYVSFGIHKICKQVPSHLPISHPNGQALLTFHTWLEVCFARTNVTGNWVRCPLSLWDEIEYSSESQWAISFCLCSRPFAAKRPVVDVLKWSSTKFIVHSMDGSEWWCCEDRKYHSMHWSAKCLCSFGMLRGCTWILMGWMQKKNPHQNKITQWLRCSNEYRKQFFVCIVMNFVSCKCWFLLQSEIFASDPAHVTRSLVLNRATKMMEKRTFL